MSVDRFWTEANLILYERTGRCRFHDFESEFIYLREQNNIDSLEDLLQCTSTKLENLSAFSAIGKELAKQVKGIQRQNQKNQAVWLTSSESPYQNNTLIYQHWLPMSESRLLGMDDSEIECFWDEILAEQYKEFDTIVHITHIDKASSILKENNLQSHAVRDNSVFSKVPEHPNHDTQVVWFSPIKKASIANTKSKYGQVAFFMKNLFGYDGIIRDPGEWNYYFVEVLEYRHESACRILATTKTYRHLTPYDPTKKGGPWYYDKANHKHYWLRDIERWDGTRGRNGNSLEIMREENTWLWDNIIYCPVGNHEKCRIGFSCNSKNLKNTDLRLYIISSAYVPKFQPEMPEDLEIKVKNMCSSLSKEIKATLDIDNSTIQELTDILKVLLFSNSQGKVSMTIIWEEGKKWIKNKLKKKIKREDLQALCRIDDLKEIILSLFWGVAAEKAALSNDNDYIQSMKEFPYFEEEILSGLEHLVN